MNLAQQIQAAQQKHEAKLAAEVDPPKVELESDELILARRFGDWCRSKGVPALPASPVAVAAFIRFENKEGGNYDRIFRTTAAIEALHDRAGVSNPCATSAVRNEVARIYHIDGPRAWSRAERLKFAMLPIEIQEIIDRRSREATKAVRTAQNTAAELRRQLEKLQPKESENGNRSVCEEVHERRGKEVAQS